MNRSAGDAARVAERGPAHWWPGAPLVALGLVALLAGAQLLAVLTIGSFHWGVPPSEMHEPWFAAAGLVGGGFVLASAGTLRIRVILDVLRTRQPLTWTVVVLTGLSVWALVVWTASVTGQPGPVVLVGTPATQVVLAGAWAVWSRANGRPLPGQLHPRTWGNLLVVVFLALSAATLALRLPDVYPFSQYTMYSHARLDPYELSRVVFEATGDDGETRALPAPASRQALLGLVREDEDRLEAVTRGLAEGHEVRRVTVYVEVIGVAEYPAPPALELRDRREVITVER